MKTISMIALLLAANCGGGGSSNNSSLGAFGGNEDSAAYSYEADEMSEEMPVTQQLTPPPAAQQTEQQIIRTANLRFESQEPTEAHAKIIGLVNKYEGIVQNDNSGKRYNELYRTFTVRIPSENFTPFLEGVAEGVDYFDQRTVSSKDVTEEFVDLQARLKAKRELENRYIEILQKAQNVKEILEIERELSNIREEIEAKQGRLEYLKSRVAMSTVTIEVYKVTSETGVTESYGQKMKNALAGGWDGISIFFLGLLYIWPLFIVGAILFLVIRWLVRKNRIPKNS